MAAMRCRRVIATATFHRAVFVLSGKLARSIVYVCACRAHSALPILLSLGIEVSFELGYADTRLLIKTAKSNKLDDGQMNIQEVRIAEILFHFGNEQKFLNIV